MNAVIGMTEMALREDLPDTARKYIGQIKSSGKILLNIINDILDFSKIESGKMDIIPDEYEILSMCNDVSSIVETRLKDKNVELLFSIEPTIPAVLYGDSNRVRQILINLANNVVKFTQKGMINISIDYKKINDENIMLLMCVEDTGCGIKKSDLNRIFDSFQQVDSKRNRGAEGTGLGLMSFAMIAPDRLKWWLSSYKDVCIDKNIFVFSEEQDIDDEFRKNIDE